MKNINNGPQQRVESGAGLTYDAIFKRFYDANVTVPGKKVKFDFGDAGIILLDGVNNKVSREDAPADTTIKVKLEVFVAMAQGHLDPTDAFSRGMFGVEGDMNVAMQLQSLMAKLRGPESQGASSPT